MTTSKSGHQAVVPDASSNVNKKKQVADMFNNIAGNYDFLNHFLSLGIDRHWRKKAIAEAGEVNPKYILDIATGTGDLALAAMKLHPEKITGVDIAERMLEAGREKIRKQGLEEKISLQYGDSESLPFEADSFDVVMCAYGVRNFENTEAGLREMYRVLRPGGKLVVLEFSHPEMFPVKQLFGIYFRFFLPLIGRLISRHNKAYTYLPESVKAFPQGKTFCNILDKCGYVRSKAKSLTLGITALYTAYK